MIEINPNNWLLKPFQHQIVGVKHVVKNKYCMLADEMGLGKTKEALDAVCELFRAGMVQVCVIFCPASIRTNYLDTDPETGEIAKHCWTPYVTYEVHSAGLREIYRTPGDGPRLIFVVTNYEFMRKSQKLGKLRIYPRVKDLIKLCKNRKVMLICDESSRIAGEKSRQTRATYEFRKSVDRVCLLNGTPIGNNVGDLYAQAKIMHPDILGFKTFKGYRERYMNMGGYMGKQFLGVLNEEELQEKLKPYILRRKKEDCIDLPPKLYTQLEVELEPKTWRAYCEMRDKMVALLDSGDVSVAQQAVVKIIRLSQITSGLLGGLQTTDEVQRISSEKLKFTADWVEEKVAAGERVIVWSRFRKEQSDLAQELLVRKLQPWRIYGGQPEGERELAIRQFTNRNNKNPAVLLGQPQAGGIGLNLTTSACCVYISSDYSMITRLQSEDRIHRLGQTKPCLMVDVLAVGPHGQKTLDHKVLAAVRHKEDAAEWTAAKWREVLTA